MYKPRADSALAFTGELIGRFGSRLAGSPACLGCADALFDAAAKEADKAWIDDFRVHPGAFLGFIRLLVAIFPVSALVLAFYPSLAALLMTVGMAVLCAEFFLYWEAVDFLYPKRKGRNVTAVLEPQDVALRQLIVSGHHDSARVFRFYVDKPERYSIRVYGGIGSFTVLWIAAIVLAVAGAGVAVRVAAAVLFSLDFVLVAPLWNFAGSEGTPGAGDNLAASAVALELLKEFRERRDSTKGLKHTRLVFVSFDAEEAGLRGARAWAKAHADMIRALPTFHYNMDCLYRAADARFLTSDINGSVKLSGRLAGACAEAARQSGVLARPEAIAFLTGGTDAAETAKAGARATTLIAMRWSNRDRSAAYHTPGDTLDSVESAAVELALEVGARVAERLDSGELD